MCRTFRVEYLPDLGGFEVDCGAGKHWRLGRRTEIARLLQCAASEILIW